MTEAQRDATGHLTFAARIETAQLGRATHTVIHLPADVAHALQVEGARRVEGELARIAFHRQQETSKRAFEGRREAARIASNVTQHAPNTHPINLALRQFSGGVCLWTGKNLLSRIGASAGDAVAVRLRKVDPDYVETPDDLAAALRSAGRSQVWEGLSAGQKRAALYQFDAASRPQTRDSRIARFVEQLAG